jgi:hypothetical protein
LRAKGGDKRLDDLAYWHDLQNGESLTVEFKRTFPENARNLADVIASFASTDGGRIYLGVTDDGTILGLRDITAQKDRDAIQRRIEGTCSSIEPRIRVSVDFVELDGSNVVVITIPAGSEPIYSVDGIPYIRDLTVSRRATSTEVKEAHRRYFLDQGPLEAGNAEQGFLIELVYQIADISLVAGDFRDHIVEPDLSQMLYDLDSTGEIMLELRLQDSAKDLGAENELRELGDGLRDLGQYRFMMSSAPVDAFGEQLRSLSVQANRLGNRVAKRLDRVRLRDISDLIRRELDILESEWGKAEKYRERGELGRLQDAFRRIGFTLNRLGNLPEPIDAKGISVELRTLAEKVRSLSSYQRYFLTGRNPLELLNDPMRDIQLKMTEIRRWFQ